MQDRQRFEPMPEEGLRRAMTAWFFSLPVTKDRNLVRCENCRLWDNSHKYWDAQTGGYWKARDPATSCRHAH